MKIAVYSDLHLEFEDEGVPTLELRDSADVLVLAGDIGIRPYDMDWIAEQAQMRPVIYVAGNHEYYGHDYLERLDELRSIFAGTEVHFLEQNAVELGGVRFLGCTLWTDFELNGAPAESMDYARRGISDFQRIRYDKGPLTPEITAELHGNARTWLADQLAQSDPARTVVVTHHAPSLKSIPPTYQRHRLSPGFASNLEPMIEHYQPALWVHGHLHDSSHYRIGKTRVRCNPRGYYPHDLNPGFENPCVVEV